MEINIQRHPLIPFCCTSTCTSTKSHTLCLPVYISSTVVRHWAKTPTRVAWPTGSIVGCRPIPIFHFHNTSLSLTSQTAAGLFPEVCVTSKPLSSSQKPGHCPCSLHICPANHTLALWEKASRVVWMANLQDPHLCKLFNGNALPWPLHAQAMPAQLILTLRS